VGYLYHPKVKRKDGTIYQDPVWWAKFYLDGRPVRRSTKTRKKGVAASQLKHWEGNPRDADPKTDRATLDELTQDYLDDYRINNRKSIGQAEDYVNRLLKTWGGRPAVTITVSEIRQYIKEMQAEGYANATVNRHLTALKRMFNLAMQAEKITRRPHIPMLKENNVRKGFLGDLEHLAVTEHLPYMLGVVAETAYTYGWRREELLTLQRTQVDLVEGIIHLDTGTTKNQEGREIRLTASLWEKYKRLEVETRALEIKTGSTILWTFHRKGKRVKDFRKAWKNACEKAKIGHRLFHDYRRSAIRNMERARVPRSTAMKVSGHRTESVYRRYAVVDQEMMDDATKRIERRAGQTALVPKQLSLLRANSGQTSTKHGDGEDSN
jgi:integrase